MIKRGKESEYTLYGLSLQLRLCASLPRLPAWLKGGQQVPTKPRHKITGCKHPAPSPGAGSPLWAQAHKQVAASSCSVLFHICAAIQVRLCPFPRHPADPTHLSAPPHLRPEPNTQEHTCSRAVGCPTQQMCAVSCPGDPHSHPQPSPL